MRTFVAVKINPTPRMAQSIVEIRELLSGEKIKWTDVFNLHLTLRFLGDTQPDTAAAISAKLEAVAGNIPPFSFSIEHTGVFPNFRSPRVLWMGIKDTGGLNLLKNEVDEIVNSAGFMPDDRPFKPHLTLGRLKYIKNRHKVKEVIEKYQGLFQKESIDKFVYFESKLTPDGPLYSEIGKYQLSGH